MGYIITGGCQKFKNLHPHPRRYGLFELCSNKKIIHFNFRRIKYIMKILS